MSFLDTGGAANQWSKVVIDTDKDMGAFGLTDLKELAAGMIPGDIIAFDAASGKMAAVHAGVIGTELLTKGNKFPPVWSFPDVG